MDWVTEYNNQENIKGETQEQKIKRILKNTNDWVCGSSFIKMYIPTYATRISELVAKGEPIQREVCNLKHHSHRGRVKMYLYAVSVITLENQQELFA